MENKENALVTSLVNTVADPAIELLSDYSELGIDTLIDDGLLKDIPFISTAISIYKIGNSIRERSHLKKLAIFLQHLRNGIEDDENHNDEYIEQFENDEHFKKKQLEYLIIILERYLDYERPKLLAILYLSFLDKKIDWNTFVAYSEILDRMLIQDFDVLFEFMCHGGIKAKEYKNIAPVLRLLSLGLVEQLTGFGDTDPNSKYYFDYYITDFGKTFVSIFEVELRKRKRA